MNLVKELGLSARYRSINYKIFCTMWLVPFHESIKVILTLVHIICCFAFLFNRFITSD